MSGKRPSEVLYDSEATLRQVDHAIQEMGDLVAEDDAPPAPPARPPQAMVQERTQPIGLIGLSKLLERGYAEILAVLDSLRESRNLLERAAVEKIQHTHDKLREVTAATESAATDILNGLDRANVIIDDLDAYAGAHGEPDARGAELRNTLRDELFALMGHMQFQDITSQQLTYASAVLTEMETRLANIARVFDPAVFGLENPYEHPTAAQAGPLNYDPRASTEGREDRQALVDAILSSKPQR